MKLAMSVFIKLNLSLFLMKLIVTVTNKLITVQEMLISLPLIEDVIALFRTTDGIQHIAVTLAMYALLEGLYVQAKIHFVGCYIFS